MHPAFTKSVTHLYKLVGVLRIELRLNVYQTFFLTIGRYANIKTWVGLAPT